MQRLDKIISSQLNISRSVARAGIRRGSASVNGETVRDPAFQLSPEEDKVEFNGQSLSYKKYIYLIMNKPKGILSASNDKSRETVVDLVPPELKRAGLFPVGRLDRDTTGLLLITDDGDFAHRVISPNKNIVKTYKVTLDGALDSELAKVFAKGVVLADGTACRPAELCVLSENVAEIKISEGKYHQIKRMFGTVGLGVNELERTALGGLALPQDLLYGQCRELTQSELKSITAF